MKNKLWFLGAFLQDKIKSEIGENSEQGSEESDNDQIKKQKRNLSKNNLKPYNLEEVDYPKNCVGPFFF